ncbi:MAG TPA: methylated-DNA--[protein]-cysteine S-methyltransferase [Myxococcota bacterium]|jgi:methylated-DNA-[protein]-cysteine S-methyltransferase|nr:methylated-DNA--[protein]-cysteine S-methyltransferase [Myxococcota bacterium]
MRNNQRGQFETSFGTCGIAWSSVGITELRLPGDPEISKWPQLEDACPAFVAQAVKAVAGYFANGQEDLASIPVDLAGMPPFLKKVLLLARDIRPGETVSYKGLATLAGSPNAARAVGQAMARNPVPLLVPCHRVLGSDKSLHGFSAAGGTLTKQRLLELETRFTKKL